MQLRNHVQTLIILLYCTFVAPRSNLNVIVLSENHPLDTQSHWLENVDRNVIEDIYACLQKKNKIPCLKRLNYNLEHGIERKKSLDINHRITDEPRISLDYLDFDEMKSLPNLDLVSGRYRGSDVNMLRGIRRNNDDFIKKKILRMRRRGSDSEDSDDSEDDLSEKNKAYSDSEDYEVLVPKKSKSKYKNNVIKHKVKPKLMYMQGPGRFMSDRRRMPRFMPKDSSESDLQKIRKLWSNKFD